MITYFDTSNRLCPFVLSQEPGICWGVWEQETGYSWMEEAVKICLAYKNDSAVIRVSVPVIIISLEEDKCFGDMLNLFIPLPRLKPCSMYVQGAKADKTDDNLTCNVYEGLQR